MLNFDWNIIWTFVNIIVLFIFLKKFLFKPVNEIIEKRQKLIADSIEEAERKKADADMLKKNYEDELTNANEQAAVIIKEARERAEVEYNRILLEAKEEAARVIAEANKVIELERKKSMESAQAEIAGLAMLAASKVIGKNVDEDINRQMLGEFIKEVGAIQ